MFDSFTANLNLIEKIEAKMSQKLMFWDFSVTLLFPASLPLLHPPRAPSPTRVKISSGRESHLSIRLSRALWAHEGRERGHLSSPSQTIDWSPTEQQWCRPPGETLRIMTADRGFCSVLLLTQVSMIWGSHGLHSQGAWRLTFIFKGCFGIPQHDVALWQQDVFLPPPSQNFPKGKAKYTRCLPASDYCVLYLH